MQEYLNPLMQEPVEGASLQGPSLQVEGDEQQEQEQQEKEQEQEQEQE